jgi:hypothetical protein
MLTDLSEEGGFLQLPPRFTYKNRELMTGSTEVLDKIETFMEQFGWAFQQDKEGKREITDRGGDIALTVIPYMSRNSSSFNTDPDIEALIAKIKDKMLERIAEDLMPIR